MQITFENMINTCFGMELLESVSKVRISKVFFEKVIKLFIINLFNLGNRSVELTERFFIKQPRLMSSTTTMRKTIEENETYLAYRWFLGFRFHDKVPVLKNECGRV
jgi:hypothetical protein